MRLLVHYGANVNIDSGEPLKEACRIGSMETIAILVEHGADMNESDPIGRTAFLEAFKNGPLQNGRSEIFLEIVGYLLKNGADVHARDGGGRSALYLAATYQGVSLFQTIYVMEKLLEAGVGETLTAKDWSDVVYRVRNWISVDKYLGSSDESDAGSSDEDKSEDLKAAREEAELLIGKYRSEDLKAAREEAELLIGKYRVQYKK